MLSSILLVPVFWCHDSHRTRPAACYPSSLGCTVCFPEMHDTQNSTFLGPGICNTQHVGVDRDKFTSIRKTNVVTEMLLWRQLGFEPEASSLRVVVIVDVGDDFREPDRSGSQRLFAAGSGDTEGHPLLGTSNPAFTAKFTLFCHGCFWDDLPCIISLRQYCFWIRSFQFGKKFWKSDEIIAW